MFIFTGNCSKAPLFSRSVALLLPLSPVWTVDDNVLEVRVRVLLVTMSTIVLSRKKQRNSTICFGIILIKAVLKSGILAAYTTGLTQVEAKCTALK